MAITILNTKKLNTNSFNLLHVSFVNLFSWISNFRQKLFELILFQRAHITFANYESYMHGPVLSVEIGAETYFNYIILRDVPLYEYIW